MYTNPAATTGMCPDGRNYTPDSLAYRNELFAPRQAATAHFPFDSGELYMSANPDTWNESCAQNMGPCFQAREGGADANETARLLK